MILYLEYEASYCDGITISISLLKLITSVGQPFKTCMYCSGVDPEFGKCMKVQAVESSKAKKSQYSMCNKLRLCLITD